MNEKWLVDLPMQGYTWGCKTKHVSEFFHILYLHQKPFLQQWPAWVMRKVSNDWSLVCPFYKLFISKCSLIKTRFIIWTIETFCWRQGRARRADIDTGRPGYYHHINVKSRGILIFYKWVVVPGAESCQNVHRKYDCFWRREIPTASNEHPDSGRRCCSQ